MSVKLRYSGKTAKGIHKILSPLASSIIVVFFTELNAPRLEHAGVYLFV